jgi:hypothetical protein
MLRIFADDEQSAFALDNLALRTALANGGSYFHDCFLLAYVGKAERLIILVLLISVQLYGVSHVTGQSGREGRPR